MKPYSVDLITMPAIKARYRELQPDGHWFDPDTMRFFNTELPARGYLDIDGNIWFVTGETNPSRVKRYTLRRMDTEGEIDTVGQFHCYTTRGYALEALHDCLRQGETA